MRVALVFGWFDFVKRDSVCGNGFQIAAYGFKLTAKYAALFLFRLLVALLFPLSALVIMRSHNLNKRYQRELARKLDEQI